MKKHFLLYFLITLFLGCEDEKDIDPEVETLSVTAISASSFLAKGNIKEYGNLPVTEYGFSYSTGQIIDPYGSYGGTLFPVGYTPVDKAFQKEFSIPANTYVSNYLDIRAYIKNERGTVYGKSITVTLPQLTISSVIPLSGKVGDQITINGSDFSTALADTKVTFNGISANVISATNTKLIVQVPSGITNSYYGNYIVIVVKTAGKEITATNDFRILPSVTGFDPQSGTFGTLVTISGSNFYGYSSTINIGGLTVYPNNTSSNSITFTIPSNITTEKSKIVLYISDLKYDLAGDFTILPPEITSISPVSGIGGSIITVTGKNFNNNNYSNNKLKLGSTELSLQYSTSTTLKAMVPKELAKGNYPVSVSTGVHTVVAANEFVLSSPQISSFAPLSAIKGTYVTINGSNFGSASYYSSDNSVLFGATTVSVYSWSENAIVVYIPLSIASGTVKITVNAWGNTVTSTDSFTIQ
jgi:hypothetical protein